MNCREVFPQRGFFIGDVAEGGGKEGVAFSCRSPSTQAIARVVGAVKSCFRFGKIFRAVLQVFRGT